ncbi:glutathione S-transferase C-terminal domain-containing protein [Streptomyces sp. SID3212]|uniref:glutathione S-transferase C-terminal domain-containing protein n=1 Tax=Streptomyces sp. SID3212 TaxID=2690259 RepID=UPI0013719ECE|nr:glutathione S-transferase C-terminal domain-containing protein [Streptomyces sp. SID3212]MYV56398.1 glutathione S-transferase family protein [Streptomyces sp. SID3212]
MSLITPAVAPTIRGRIGCDARSGHYAVPRRYRLHLSPACPTCLEIAVTHSLLDLGDTLPVTLLPAVPDGPGGGYEALLPLYEATSHHHPGPAAAPVLSDGWTGRIVSTYVPDILRDLSVRFGGSGPELRPRGTEEEIEALALLCERDLGVNAGIAGRPDTAPEDRDRALHTLFAALDTLEQRLEGREFALGGDTPTAADVQLWVALAYLDTVHRPHLDTVAARCVAHYPRLWDYARRLAARPAFGAHLDLAAVALKYHARCPCPAGAPDTGRGTGQLG